jgi:hypothetical protein
LKNAVFWDVTPCRSCENFKLWTPGHELSTPPSRLWRSENQSHVSWRRKVFLIGIVRGGVKLGPLGTATTNRPIVPTPGDYDDGKIGGVMIGSGKQSTRIKPVPVPLCPPQTPHAARTRTGAAAEGSQRLTAWATAQVTFYTGIKAFRFYYFYDCSNIQGSCFFGIGYLFYTISSFISMSLNNLSISYFSLKAEFLHYFLCSV